MSPDDERLDAKAGTSSPLTSDEAAQARPDTDGGADDLGSLGRSLEASRTRDAVSGAEAEHESDVESNRDLSALASAGRGGLPTEEIAAAGARRTRARASTALVSKATRAGWLVPLLVGLGLGLGSAGALFALSGVARLNSMARSVRASVGDATTPPGSAGRAIPHQAVVDRPAAEHAPASAQSAPVAPPADALPAQAESPSQPLALARREVVGRPSSKASVARSPLRPEGRLDEVTTPAAMPAAHAAAPGSTPRSPHADAAAAPAAPGPAASMDSLLDEALAPPAQLQAQRERQQAALGRSELPVVPSRDDVAKSMTVLLPAIRGCTAGQSGLATATIVVRNDGHVAAVEVLGSPFGGMASGRCMEGVIRRARFPAFQQASFRVKFPMAIQ